jgi:hypothetical protein
MPDVWAAIRPLLLYRSRVDFLTSYRSRIRNYIQEIKRLSHQINKQVLKDFQTA